MAYIVPSDIGNLALAGCHEPELATLARLKRELPADYTVFHSVHWTREYKGRTAFGEADFVLLNRSGEGLVVEQKNGHLEESAEGLRKRYQTGSTDPFFQVRRSVDGIKEKFSRVHRGKERLVLDYLVYCPDHRVRSVNAVGLDASRLVDASADGRLASRIEEILDAGRDAPSWRERVEAFFRQSFEIHPDIHAHRRAGDNRFVRLSGGLADNLGNIEMEPLRLRVRGSPGCGKTVVARRFFKRAVEQGRRPLLVCFNRALKEKIKASCPQGGLVETWYGLCHRFLESRGETLDFERVQQDPAFWNDIQDRVVTSPIDDGWLFDTVIVDEGQDFEQEWADVLRLFAREGADMVWLEDRDQGIRGNAPVALAGFVGFNAKTNYRSPKTIARFMRKALPFAFEPANDLPGLGVGVHRYRDSFDQSRLVAKTVADLLSRGFAAEDIVILSIRGIGRTGLGVRKRVGNYTLRRFAGEYDLLGNQEFTDGQLLLESVYRFKGQQAPAVIVIDVESGKRDQGLTERLLYTAFSRATVRLDVIVRSDDPLADGLIAAMN